MSSSVASRSACPSLPSSNSVKDAWPYIEYKLEMLVQVILDETRRSAFTLHDYMDLYSLVYNLSTKASINTSGSSGHPKDEILNLYYQWMESYFQRFVTPAIEGVDGESLLIELIKQWETLKIIVSWSKKLFAYLDRSSTFGEKKMSVGESGPNRFTNLVSNGLDGKILRMILSKIEREREGDILDRSTMRSAIEILQKIPPIMNPGKKDVYQLGEKEPESFFEGNFVPQLINASEEYYSKKSQDKLKSASIPEYLRFVDRCFEDERDRVYSYLHDSVWSGLNLVLQHHLIDLCLSDILDDFISLVQNDAHHRDLGLMYRLISDRSEAVDQMKRLFNDEIRRHGETLLLSCQGKVEKMNDVIFGLLQMYCRYKEMCSLCFQDSAIFVDALKNGLENVLNGRVPILLDDESFPPLLVEYYALFCDALLKPAQREKFEKAETWGTEKLFEVTSEFLRYFLDKDYFQDSYRDLLSKRLLDSSFDETDERSMISNLKMKYGTSFTSKMETMINDNILSKDQAKDFKESLEKKHLKLPIRDFQALVLTESSWPHFSPDSTYRPCEELQACMDEFTLYYSTINNSRVLHWIHSLGKAVLTGHFTKAPRELSMTAYQASLCMLFNFRHEILIEEAIKMTGIPSDELKRAIMGLVAGKYKILHRSGTGKSVSNEELISVNLAFESPKIKVSIPLPKKPQKKASQKQHEREGERKYAIEAAAVRIMKARKALLHHELIGEILEQLKLFRPQPRLIKERIEDLIGRGFLRRDEENSQMFHYVA